MTTQTYGIGVESLLVILEWGSIPCGALLTCCIYMVCGSTYSLRCLAHCVVFTRHATIRSSHNSITVTILGSRYDLSQFYFNFKIFDVLVDLIFSNDLTREQQNGAFCSYFWSF